MSDRDDLADLIEETFHGPVDKAHWGDIADAILARWRLVPVPTGGVIPAAVPDGIPVPISDAEYWVEPPRKSQGQTPQRDAADELTRHDEALGLYDDEYTGRGINNLRVEVDGFTFTFARDIGPITEADLDHVTAMVEKIREIPEPAKKSQWETTESEPTR